MSKYLNLDGLQTLWTKAKNTFAPKSHNHNASDINAGTLLIERGGTGATTRIGAEYNLLSGVESMDATLEDARLFPIKNNTVSASNGVFRWYSLSRLWSYFRTKLGISSAVGGSANPVYVDSNGQLKAVGGTMLKQGSLIDTHSEGSRTILIDGTNELFAFYDRGGTCTAYEYDLEWNSSSPAPAGTFNPADLSSHKTTTSVASFSANVFNSLTGYNQSTVYSGTKYAVYDLKLPASFSYGTTFYWSFGNAYWKPHYFEVLVWKNDATQYPNGYISKYRSTSVGAYGSVAVSVGETEGNSFTHIRIVMDKYSRLAAFGVVNYSSIGLATNYMSRTVDKSLYRNITVAKNNAYDLGSSSAKWANIYATNFNGALKGNADTASAAKSGSALETSINAKQDALTSQTAYSSKGSATKVPKITTNALGQVTNIEEVTITQPDVSGKADDTAVVHLSGTETVTGVKTFSNSTTNIVNPQATDITRLRVFKPGETNWNGGVRLQLEYDPNGGRGLWDSNISENDGNVLWIDAYGRVILHGTADLAAGVTTNGKTNSVTSGSTLCLTSGGAFSNLLRKGTVGGFFVLKSTVRKQLANRNTWYNLSQNLPFVMPPKSAVLLTFSVVSMNADQSLSPAYAFTAQFYCGTSSPPADGTKQGYIFTQQMTTGSVRILPILAVNDSDEIKNFCLWAKAKDSYDVNFYLDGGSIWGMGLYGTDFIAI